MSQVRKLFLATIVLSLFSFNALAATHWDLPVVWPAENYITKNVVEFAKAVEKVTNGNVKVTVHPGGSLGFKGPEMFSAVRDGLVPIGNMLLNQQVGENPALGIECLPFLFGSAEEQRAFHSYDRPMLEDIYSKGNQIILFSMSWPQQQIFVNRKIESIDDMKNLKLRTSDKATMEVYAAAGMNPVQMPWGDVVPALAAGTIEGVATSSPSAVDGAFWEFVKYFYPTRHSWSTDIVSVNKDAWAALSKEDQQKISALAKEMEPKFWERSKEIDKTTIQILLDHGMVQGTISDGLRAELRNRSQAAKNSALKKMGKQATDIVKAFENR